MKSTDLQRVSPSASSLPTGACFFPRRSSILPERDSLFLWDENKHPLQNAVAQYNKQLDFPSPYDY
jgi:hypothetical protein